MLIEIDGVKVLTDPLFREWLLHLRRHAPAIDMAIFGQPDVILISHAHLDHLDRQSLKRIAREAHVIAPRDAGKILLRLGYGHVTTVTPGEHVDTHGLKITAVPAIHGGGRMPWGADADTLGFIVEGERSFYFAGDTDIYPAMGQLGALTRDGIDLALLPVWGWGPKVGPGHLNPTSAARAAGLIGAHTTVPIHWGGYLPAGLGRSHARLLKDPPREFARIVERMSLPTDVQIVEPGGKLELATGAGAGQAAVERNDE